MATRGEQNGTYCAAEADGFLSYIIDLATEREILRDEVADELEAQDKVLVGGNWTVTSESDELDLLRIQDVLGGEIIDDPADVDEGSRRRLEATAREPPSASAGPEMGRWWP